MQLKRKQAAHWETTSRLFASLLNENLVFASPAPCPDDSHDVQGLRFHGKHGLPENMTIWVALSRDFNITNGLGGKQIYHPEDFAPHVLLSTEHTQAVEFEPGIILALCRPFLNVDESIDQGAWNQIVSELQNSAENQSMYY